MASTHYILAAAFVALAPACVDDENEVVVVSPVDDAVAEGHATGNALADDAFVELDGDDPRIVLGKTASILAAINDGQIRQASFAINIISAGDILQFADDEIADHDAANTSLDAVVRFIGTGFIPSSAADSVTAEANAGLGELRATPPGDFDITYIDLQVRMHASAQVLLDELLTQVGPGDMGNFILDMQAMNDQHLANAQFLLSTFF